MPGEEHAVACLGGDIVADELFQQMVVHQRPCRLRVELRLVEIVAVLAGEVAHGAYRLGHHIEWA